MAELGRVGNSWNFNFRVSGVFQRFCKSARSASRQCENFMESLHSDGSATYLLIILVEKIIPLTMKSKQKPYPSIVFLSIFQQLRCYFFVGYICSEWSFFLLQDTTRRTRRTGNITKIRTNNFHNFFLSC